MWLVCIMDGWRVKTLFANMNCIKCELKLFMHIHKGEPTWLTLSFTCKRSWVQFLGPLGLGLGHGPQIFLAYNSQMWGSLLGFSKYRILHVLTNLNIPWFSRIEGICFLSMKRKRKRKKYLISHNKDLTFFTRQT